MPELSLPQNDPIPGSRAEALEVAQSAWTYGCWEKLQCFVKRVPVRDMPRIGWILKVIPPALRAVWNHLRYLLVTKFSKPLRKYPFRKRRGKLGASRLLGVPEAWQSGAGDNLAVRVARSFELLGYRAVDGLMGLTLARDGTGSAPSTPIPHLTRKPRIGITLEDFKKVYQSLPIPKLAEDWTSTSSSLTDAEFCWQRVAGPNPEMLVITRSVPIEFPGDLPVPGLGTLADACRSGNIYIADYSPLAILKSSTWHGMPRFVRPARAMFACDAGGLRPIAIQCEPGGRIFQPGDPGWDLAKHIVQVADGNHHELVSHLGLTHLLVELFVMATRRNLAPNHPLLHLLLPHFEGTLFINDQARNGLIAPGGAIDQIFAGTITSSRALTIESLLTLDFDHYDLPARTKARGVDSIPDYPWRDDALEVWHAIERFVRAYVGKFYKSDDDVTRDAELHAWSDVLSMPVADGGVAGFRAPESVEDVVRIFTLVIYTASAQHAAVNFPQYPVMSFSPMVAGSGWAPGPDVVPLSNLVEFLPPRLVALKQAETLYLLSAVHHTQLGHYDAEWIARAGVGSLVSAFQQELARIEARIASDNSAPGKRREPYTHLLPSLIPQSINI